MTDILQTRANIIQRLNEIQSIPKQGYSAMQLHGSYSDRAQRREDTFYYQRLRAQEKKLLQDLKLVDSYLDTSSSSLPSVNGDVPLIPVPETSLWSGIPLPKRQLTRMESRPRIGRRIR